MKRILFLTILAVLFFAANGAWADDGPYPVAIGGPTGVVTPNDTTGEVEIYQAIDSLLGPTLGTYTSNAQVDSLEYTGNTSTWENTGNGAYTVIGLGAGATNSLDVYSATPVTPTPTLISPLGVGYTGNMLIGAGTSSDPYTGAASSFAPGTPFGFALNSNNYGTITNWYSNPNFNSDGMDHMVVYSLSALNGDQVYVSYPGSSTPTLVTLENPYFLAFEDSPETNPLTGAPSDLDYNDLMVLINGVGPTSIAPVPEPMTVALLAFGLLGMAGFAMRRKFAIV